MEDLLTLILIIALAALLKPIIKAILRVLGSTDHYRDR